MDSVNIRNFCIIAHIDHGKSTLADRFLEITQTVEKRKMQEQYLDMMELEKERGITIKLQPVRMFYKLEAESYQLNLIDTPGHIDFSYEVSRSLKAVEGAVLLVDATQGVQAQTVGNLEMAKALGLTIIPVINKIDSQNAMVEETEKEIIEILGCKEEEILKISARTGQGVEELLNEIIHRVPSPLVKAVQGSISNNLKGLVFDFDYSSHLGVILYIRIFDGEVKKGDTVFLRQANKSFAAGEVGMFSPTRKPAQILKSGEIGYLITNIKEANTAKVGDTLLFKNSKEKPLSGYKEPSPVVWAGVYPESQDDFLTFKKSLERLKLSDSALVFEEEENGILGRGFRCGFLGMLHLEITTERLRREFNLKLVATMPSVIYRVEDVKGEVKKIYSPALFPEHYDIKKIFEPWAKIKIITPFDKLGPALQVLEKHDAAIGDTEDFGASRMLVNAKISLREMMRNFFEEIKSATAGYASFSYEITEEREADLVKLDVLLNDEPLPAFSKIVTRKEMQREARKTADNLKEFLPAALFTIKIQIKALGRILAAQSIAPLKKDVAGYLYGGDRTRKMKLWQKQKRGKEKLKKLGRVNVPHDVFLKMIKN